MGVMSQGLSSMLGMGLVSQGQQHSFFCERYTLSVRLYFFLATPTVRPLRPVVFVCWPRTRRPQ